MSFDTLTADQQTQLAQQLAEFMGGDPAQMDASMLETLATHVFDKGQSLGPVAQLQGNGRDLLTSEDEIETPASPKANFAQLTRRAADGVALSANEVFLVEALSQSLYNVDITLDGELSPAEIAELTVLSARLEAGDRAPAIGRDFNISRMEEAERVAAEAEAALDAAQGVLGVQAQMAAAGWIPASEVTGTFTDAHVDIFIEKTFMDMDAQQSLQRDMDGSIRQIVAKAFADPANGDFTVVPEQASAIMDHFLEGRDFSATIEAAVSGDLDSIRVLEALSGSRIDGELDVAAIDAAINMLEGDQMSEFPPSMIDYTGDVMTGSVIEALQSGELYLPEGQNAQMYAIQLSDPANHEAYIALVNSQEPNAALIGQLQTMRADIEAGVKLEAASDVAAKATVTGSVEAILDADESPYGIETAAAEAALARAETARIEGDVGTQIAEQEKFFIEAQEALADAEVNFVSNILNQFRTAGHHLGNQGSEHAELFQTGTPEQIAAFIRETPNGELHEILYNSNTNLYPILSGSIPGAGWQAIVDAKGNLEMAREDFEAFRALHPEYDPVQATPEGEHVEPVEPVDPAALISDARGIIDQGAPLTGSEVSADPRVDGTVITASFVGATTPTTPGGAYVVDQGMGIAARPMTLG